MKTTSYKISKQLAEAGFKAETDFYWAKWNEGDPELVHAKDGTPSLIEKVLAWDLETILEALPNQLGESFLQITMLGNQALIGYELQRMELSSLVDGKNESLADTAARLWLELKKKKIF
jgi:hypothetical protein